MGTDACPRAGKTKVASYKLRHVRDLVEVPIERLDACLTDLRRLVLAAHAMRVVAGDDVKLEFPTTVEWRDDDDRSADVKLRHMGQVLATAHIGPARPDQAKGE